MARDKENICSVSSVHGSLNVFSHVLVIFFFCNLQGLLSPLLSLLSPEEKCGGSSWGSKLEFLIWAILRMNPPKKQKISSGGARGDESRRGQE